MPLNPLQNHIHSQIMPKKQNQLTITKKAFIEKLSQRTNIDEKTTSKIFLESLDLIVDTLKAGHKLEFRGTLILGSKIQESRLAQNPKTLEKVTIPERRVVYFKKGDRLKNIHTED
jgi:integration host factor subunit beta